jgi:membrane protease YdiL (CAAX protease family)
MEAIDQAEREALPALWDAKSLWVGFGVAVLLYVLLSVLGVFWIEWFGWQYTPKIALVVPITQLGMALPPLLIMARHGSLIRLLGLNRFHWSMLLETGTALVFGFLGSALWGLTLFALTEERAQEPYLPQFGEGIGALLSLLVVAGVMAPLAEEILFRGFLFTGLTRFTGPIRAAMLSGALFAGMHLQLLAFPALFVLGVVLALLYHRTGSLWMPILMHLCINVLATLAQFAAASEGLL